MTLFVLRKLFEIYYSKKIFINTCKFVTNKFRYLLTVPLKDRYLRVFLVQLSYATVEWY